MPVPNYIPFEELLERYPILKRFGWDSATITFVVHFGLIDIIWSEEDCNFLFHEGSFVRMVYILEKIETKKKNKPII